jgi:hypothetical protein
MKHSKFLGTIFTLPNILQKILYCLIILSQPTSPCTLSGHEVRTQGEILLLSATNRNAISQQIIYPWNNLCSNLQEFIEYVKNNISPYLIPKTLAIRSQPSKRHNTIYHPAVQR